MKCRLCDRPTTPGSGKLCLDCTKALHRARAGPASARKEPASPPAQADELATIGPALTPSPTMVTAPAWRTRAWAAAGIIAIGIVYFAQSGPEPRRALDAVVVDRAPAASTPRSHVDLSVDSTPLEAPSSTTQAVAVETPGITPAPQAKAELNAARTSPSASAKGSSRAGTASTNANRDSSASSAAYALANDAATKSKAPAEAETSQLLAQRSVSAASSPADGAQVLASALEKCGKEAFLSRFVCEQKMYMQYCEDKWEKDPRCMRKTGNN